MISEHDLRRLIRDAADTIPPPGRAPEQLVAQLTRPTTPPRPAVSRQRTMTALKVLGAAAALIALFAGLATLGSNSSSDLAGTARDVDQLAPSTTVAAGGGASEPTDGAKIVKTGSIDLEVPRGGFEAAVARITSETVGLGGYVKASTTSQASDRPRGSITVRVPVDSYEELLAGFRKLGKVGSVTSKGTDVTAQFTDLEARLDALVATRDRLSAVLAQASTVGDILAVQDRITQVQTEIEQLQGQMQVLEDQASFATLSATLGEPGSAVRPEPDEGEGRGLGQAWDDARRRFGDGIEGMVASSGPIAIILIIGAILFVLGRLGWVLVRRFTM